jgi:hypothetical protein
LELFKEVTGGRSPPKRRVSVGIFAIGRGGGKDSFASAIVAYLAITYDRKRWKLRPGERPVVLLMAVDREQANVSYDYIKGLFEASPTLRREVADWGSATNPSIELRSGVIASVHTRDYRTIRGRRVIAAIFDEAGFWPTSESAVPGSEVDVAVESGMARQPDSMLLMISSVHRRSGMFYERFNSAFGKDDVDTLAVLGTTTQFNPLFDQSIIDRHLKRDRALFGAEYLSRWRDDLQNYLTRDQVEAAVDLGVTARPPHPGLRYEAFCDMSDGQKDSSCVSIVHKVRTAERVDIYVQDCLLEIQAPHQTEHAVIEIANTLKRYGLHHVYGDDHSRKWVIPRFKAHGIEYRRPLDVEEKYQTRSDLYRETLSLFSDERVRLLENERLINQYCELERRILASGMQRIDHPNRSGFHDDLANATAGSLWAISQTQQGLTNAMIERALKELNGEVASNPFRQSGFGPDGRPGERMAAQLRAGIGSPISWGDLGSMGKMRQ